VGTRAKVSGRRARANSESRKGAKGRAWVEARSGTGEVECFPPIELTHTELQTNDLTHVLQLEVDQRFHCSRSQSRIVPQAEPVTPYCGGVSAPV
jgi:hypothetical protein